MSERIFIVGRGEKQEVRVREMEPEVPGNLDSRWIDVYHKHIVPIDRFSPSSVGEGVGMGHRDCTCVIKFGEEFAEGDRREFMTGLVRGVERSSSKVVCKIPLGEFKINS